MSCPRKCGSVLLVETILLIKTLVFCCQYLLLLFILFLFQCYFLLFFIFCYFFSCYFLIFCYFIRCCLLFFSVRYYFADSFPFILFIVILSLLFYSYFIVIILSLLFYIDYQQKTSDTWNTLVITKDAVEKLVDRERNEPRGLRKRRASPVSSNQIAGSAEHEASAKKEGKGGPGLFQEAQE
jgi:hypothetical protein